MTFLKSEHRYECYGFGAGKHSISLTGYDEKSSIIDDNQSNDENIIQSDNTSMVSRKRSEDVTGLPVIPEEDVPSEGSRKRHFAGAPARRISHESRPASLLQELAEIKVPEKLPEPFD